jgi:hypothetical protein
VDCQVAVLHQVQRVGRVTLVTEHLVACECPRAGNGEKCLAIVFPQRFQQPPHAASEAHDAAAGRRAVSR